MSTNVYENFIEKQKKHAFLFFQENTQIQNNKDKLCKLAQKQLGMPSELLKEFYDQWNEAKNTSLEIPLIATIEVDQHETYEQVLQKQLSNAALNIAKQLCDQPHSLEQAKSLQAAASAISQMQAAFFGKPEIVVNNSLMTNDFSKLLTD